jgi:predicted enzyme related to lactoylglutathione lyase
MSERDSSPAGVPCWVSTLHHDIPAARAFYEGVFGWETVGPEGVPASEATFAVARVRGREVAVSARTPSPTLPPPG